MDYSIYKVTYQTLFDWWINKPEEVAWVAATSKRDAKRLIVKLKTGESKQFSVFKKVKVEN